MRVLGVDLGNPGGLAVVESGRPLLRLIYTEATHGDDLWKWQQHVHAIAVRYQVELIACELPGTWGAASIGMAQRERCGLVKAVCRKLKLRRWRNPKLKTPKAQPMTIQPQSVKKAVTGDGRADKAKVRKFIRLDLGRFPGDDKDDVCDAVAIAATALGRAEGEQRRARAQQQAVAL